MRGRVMQSWMAGVCACAVMATPLGGQAQQAAAPVNTNTPGQEVTTVEALTVTGTINVGQGATYFQPTELQLAAETARLDFLDAQQAVHQCHNGGTGFAEHREDLGDFDLEALWSTEASAQREVARTGEAARAATEAALNARADANAGKADQARLEQTELARQDAVRAYQAAQAKAREAHYRVSDLQQMALEYVAGNLAAAQDLEAHKYIADCDPTGNGTLIEDKDLPKACMRVSGGLPKGEGMEQFRAEVEARTAERARGGGFTLYVPKEFQDLKITGVSAHQGEEKGVSFLRVVGNIVNSRKNPITSPPLWIAAVDQFGTELKAQQVEAPRSTGKIAPGASLPFIYVFSPMPDRTAKATVTFAPLHRASGPLNAEAFCPVVFPPDGSG